MTENRYRKKEREKAERKLARYAAEMPEFVREFLEGDGRRSAATSLAYYYDICYFFSYLTTEKGFGKKKYAQFTIKDMEQVKHWMIMDYKNYLASDETDDDGKTIRKHLSDAGINRKLSSISSLFKFLTENGLTASNPADIVKRVRRKEGSDAAPLKPEQVKRLLEGMRGNRLIYKKHFDGEGKVDGKKVHEMSHVEFIRKERFALRNYAIVMLLIATGMKVSELAALDLRDIDLINGTVRITRGSGKRDTVYLPDDAAAALLDYIEGGKIPSDIFTERYDAEDMILFCRENHKKENVLKAAHDIFPELTRQDMDDLRRCINLLRRQGRSDFVRNDKENAFFLSQRGHRMSVRMIEELISGASHCYLPDFPDATSGSFRATAAVRFISQSDGSVEGAKAILGSNNLTSARRAYDRRQHEKLSEQLSHRSIFDF